MIPLSSCWYATKCLDQEMKLENASCSCAKEEECLALNLKLTYMERSAGRLFWSDDGNLHRARLQVLKGAVPCIDSSLSTTSCQESQGLVLVFLALDHHHVHYTALGPCSECCAICYVKSNPERTGGADPFPTYPSFSSISRSQGFLGRCQSFTCKVWV